ncbi:solute carrier family 35 member E3 [Microdochium nivale]|nr:solute carrier family 35 member E3 [Microdochium nivale]
MAVGSTSRDSGDSSRLSLDSINALEKDNLLDQDVEAQKFYETKPVQPVNHEDTIATRKKLIALAGYFVCNIGLTIYNKAVLGSFKFPWLLTALHAGCSSIGTTVMLQLGHYHTAKLNQREHIALIAFSFLFTINIAISNVSLAMVSVPFHQLVRALTPLFTTILFRVFFSRTFSTETYLSLIPIIFGVSLATYGELKFTDLGFMLTFLGVLLAAFKTIVTNKMMTGSLNLSFWEILRRMSPLACIQSIIYAWLTGELAEFYHFFTKELLAPGYKWSPWQFFFIMAGNGMLAFALNVSSFSTNKIAGALTMTVCANIKQCLTIILGSVLFEVNLSIMNMWGILVTVAGAAVYSFVELDSKRRLKAAQVAAVAAGATRD